MLYRLRSSLNQRVFDLAARGILRTPPLEARPAPIRIVTMLGHSAVTMYLCAIKSLYRHLPGGAVEVLDDGSLTAGDRAILEHHVRPISIRPIAGVGTGPCPRGGCWERLLHVVDASRDTYVIQMDSDILTTGPVPQVVASAEANTAFTLGCDPKDPIETLEEAAARVANYDPSLTQFRAEQVLPGLPPKMGRLYVRGSAGFTGFPRGGVDRASVERFSAAMESMMPGRWAEWGTEQVASNYLLANQPGALVLPWPQYCCFYPHVDHALASLLHFIGSHRHSDGVYVRAARQVIGELRAS